MLLDASDQLTLSQPAYQQAVKFYVWQAYLNDMSGGDVTVHCFIRMKKEIVTAEIIAKESGLLAGMMESEWFLKKIGIRILQKKKDGASLKKGDVILRLTGRADKILGAERTLLNLLQRMSGVATATCRLASCLPKSIQLLATRKTLWGDLDKRAVSIGGGGTHRLNLNDAILIKENHIALSDEKSFERALKKAGSVRFIEIELENLKQVTAFAAFYSLFKPIRSLVVMLDDFKPADIKKAVSILLPLNVTIEVSGGINEKNIKKYAIKGVAAISSGSITNRAPCLDFSLNLIP